MHHFFIINQKDKLLKSILSFMVFLLISFEATTMTQQNPSYLPLNELAFQQVLGFKPPEAEKIPELLNHHDEDRIDHYTWLRDKQWPEVRDQKILKYLTEENAYSEAFLKYFNANFEAIYQEMVHRIKLKDSSVPVKKGQYYYFKKTNEDSNYPIYCRTLGKNGQPEIILDVNQIAKNFKQYNIDAFDISSDHQKLLYSEDTSGGERYTVKVKNLSTQQNLPDTVENTLHSVVWNKEGTGFFYSKINEHWRTDEIYFHKLGDPQSKDTLLYKENDPLFMVHLHRSSDKDYLFLISQSKTSTEVRFIDLTKPDLQPKLIQARKEELLYEVDHHHDHFFIRTNDTHKNFRIAKVSVKNPSQENWQSFIEPTNSDYINEFSLYKNYLVYSAKVLGLTEIKLINLTTLEKEAIKFPDQTYDAHLKFTTFEDTGIRIQYSSLITPETILEYDFKTKETTVLKEMEIPSGYQKDLYQTERLFATSKDGVKIPISIVYKKSLFHKNGKNPLYLYGYGAYGAAMSASFRPTILSLLDRGFVYAIAHVRGGDELGYEWYESAKFLNKRKTFDDFIETAEYLIKEKYTEKGQITITGRSAGGMLIGFCVNERPELFKVAVADVPFVDVLNTMLDDTLPLTPGEFKEWGNPKNPEYYHYIKSYSPYDNIKSQSYPAMYVSAGLNDPRVTYWEPAKWVAKIREMKTDDNLLLLHTNMDAGHAGSSGRFAQLKELAKEYLFIFHIYGMN